MRCLLDTHTLIWYFENNGKLSEISEKIIDDPQNTIYVSAATLWEIAIKKGLGKLNIDFDGLLDKLDIAGFLVIQTETSYLSELFTLPQLHKDPFD